MGMFLSLSGVIGKTESEVVSALNDYVKSVKGEFQEIQLNTDDGDCCSITEANGNVTIAYPGNFFDWDGSSAYLSKILEAPVFSFHIHDGDLWMYVLFYDGQIVDQFNPIPEYWDDSISEVEMKSWAGNAEIVAKYVSGLAPNAIDKYLVHWDIDDENTGKAYPDDENMREDWQLLDFMKKLGLPMTIDENGRVSGKTYKLIVKQPSFKPEEIIQHANPTPAVLPFEERGKPSVLSHEKVKKPWWKFW